MSPRLSELLPIIRTHLKRKYSAELALRYEEQFNQLCSCFNHRLVNFFLSVLQNKKKYNEYLSFCCALSNQYPREYFDYLFAELDDLQKEQLHELKPLIENGEIIICPDSPAKYRQNKLIWLKVCSIAAAMKITSSAEIQKLLYDKITKLFFAAPHNKNVPVIVVLFQATAMTNLTELHAPNCDLTRRGWVCIAKNLGLKVLNLAHNYLDDDMLEDIGKMRELEILNLEDNSISAFGIAHLAKLPRLKYLHIGRNGLNVKSLVPLKKAPALKFLCVTSNEITEEDVRYVFLGSKFLSAKLKTISISQKFIDPLGNEITEEDVWSLFFRHKTESKSEYTKLEIN